MAEERTLQMAHVAVVEGGLLRAVYVNGKEVPVEVLDFDVLDGGDREEIETLAAAVKVYVDAGGTDLARDLSTWTDSIHQALEN